ncbi:YMD3 protein, partial [Pseudoatta argentina]
MMGGSAEKRKHGEMLPSTIRAIICGPSNCGKTNVLISLLESPNGSKYRYLENLFTSALKRPTTHWDDILVLILTPNVKRSSSCAATVKPKCHFCQGDHVIYYCKNFVALPVSQRAAEIHSRKLCVNCLRSSFHASSKCTSGQCKVCQAKHNTLLHMSSAVDPSTNNTDKEVASKEIPSSFVVATYASGSFNSEQVMLSTAVVLVCDGSRKACRALLDCGSQANFVSRFRNAPIKCDNAELHEHVNRAWQMDDISAHSDNYTMEKSICERHFLDNVSQNSQGRYTVKFPIREQMLNNIGDSREAALKRLQGIEKRFKRDQYAAFLDKYLSLGHMRWLEPPESIIAEEPISFYLPHHCVFKTVEQTWKIYVVFDASCFSSSGVSLNDALLVGPTVQQDLISILMRFRFFAYVITADIIKMYRQILVHPSQMHLQRILWRDDLSANVDTYERSSVHSRFSALRDFYVDDMLTGANIVDELKLIRDEIIQLEIQCLTEIKHWRHITFSDNPADILSRELNPCDVINAERWWNGPEFLKWDEKHWPPSVFTRLNNDLPEQREIRVTVSISHPCIVDDLLNKYSNLNKIRRIVAYCLRLSKAHREHAISDFVSPVESSEYQALVKNEIVNASSDIISLSPFLDKSGLMRVGGRLKNSNFAFNACHPILLPCKHILTQHYRTRTHTKFARGSVINYIYWDDPNEIVDRLRLLEPSRQVGHKGHDNEILSIIEELREATGGCSRDASFYARFNRDYHYILTVIDMLSKHAWAKLLKAKSRNEVIKAIAKIIRDDGTCPKNLYTDRGKEFYNLDVEQVRWTVSLKSKGGRETTDAIVEIIRASGRCPKNLLSRSPKLLETVYSAIRIASPAKFKVGNLVRVSKYKTVFEKSYTLRFDESHNSWIRKNNVI